MDMFVVHKGKAQSEIMEKPQEKKEEVRNSLQEVHVPHCRPRNKVSAGRESLISPEELSGQRISSDLIVNQSEDAVALAQSITCPMCLNLFTIPYQECQVCSNGFCEPCITSWWQKNPDTCIYKCPNRNNALT